MCFYKTSLSDAYIEKLKIREAFRNDKNLHKIQILCHIISVREVFAFYYVLYAFPSFVRKRIKKNSTEKNSLPVDSTIPHICTSTESWDTQTHIYLVMYNKTAETGCDLWWQKRVISITTATWEKKGKKFVYFFLCVMRKMAVQQHTHSE